MVNRVDLRCQLLPDRRTLTDRFIIPAVQREAGLPLTPVSDRRRRFEFSRRYRELNPGGMAQALAALSVAPEIEGWLVFDGLRGAAEVTWAAAELPRARFLVLEAPDFIRLQRLISRRDPFDQVKNAQDPKGGSFALGAAGRLFTPDEQKTLHEMIENGAVTPADLRAKLEIISSEKENYDAGSTHLALLQAAPERVLVVDTSQETPDRGIDKLIHWLPDL